MSEIRMAYPVREMLELVEQPTLDGVPWSARWWRLRLLPQPDGIYYETHIDDMDALDSNAKATIRYRWSDDGRSEVVEPYAAQIVTEHGEPPFLGRESIVVGPSRVDAWIDALTVDPPTTNPRWEQLTNPGNHRHPNALEEIAWLRAARRLPPIWAEGLAGR